MDIQLDPGTEARLRALCDAWGVPPETIIAAALEETPTPGQYVAAELASRAAGHPERDP
jgi:hypothetical protein